MRGFVILSCFFLTLGYAASTDLVDFTSANQGDSGSEWSLGFRFSVNSPIAITGLGTFDYAQDGFARPQQVGLWTDDGLLLASTYVDNSDPLQGIWRFRGITPLLLTVGQTYRVASQGGEGYAWYTNGFTVAPEIMFVDDRWAYVPNSADPLTFPGATLGVGAADGGGLFGGNAQFAATPEPGTWLAGLGCLALVLFGRRR